MNDMFCMPAEPAFPELQAACERAIELSARVEKGQALLKELSAELNALRHSTIPDLMSAENRADYESPAGKVELSFFVSTRPKAEAKERFPAVLAAMDGAEDIIKPVVTAEFGKGDLRAAEEWAKTCPAGLANVEMKVHPSTFKAFVKGKMTRGEDVPLDDLGIHAGQLAFVKLAGDEGG